MAENKPNELVLDREDFKLFDDFKKEKEACRLTMQEAVHAAIVAAHEVQKDVVNKERSLWKHLGDKYELDLENENYQLTYKDAGDQAVLIRCEDETDSGDEG